MRAPSIALLFVLGTPACGSTLRPARERDIRWIARVEARQDDALGRLWTAESDAKRRAALLETCEASERLCDRSAELDDDDVAERCLRARARCREARAFYAASSEPRR